MLQKINSEIREEAEDLKCLFNFSTDLLCIAGTDGYFKRVNPAFEKLLGYSAAEILNISFFDFVHPDDAAATIDKFESICNGLLCESYEVRYRCKDGNYLWLSWNAKANNSFIYAIARDVTEIKAARNELEEQKKILFFNSAKLCTIGEMALGIGHEINNPVTIINLMSNQMQRLVKKGEPLTPEAINKCVSKIEDASLRIAKIVNGLKTLARDGEEDSFQQANLHCIVDEMVEVSLDFLKKNNIKITINKLNYDPIIECRSSQISQVLLNLINNSCDAIKNFEEKWIEIEFLDKNGFMHVCVTDCGHGIPIELHAKIFDSFFTSKAIGEGTGLGLSISKKIIESHGGTLTIDKSCSNTKFILSIPKIQSKTKLEAMLAKPAETDIRDSGRKMAGTHSRKHRAG